MTTLPSADQLSVLEYLTLEEAAIMLRLSPTAVRGLMRRAELLEGEHYFRLPSGHLRFKAAKVRAWVEGPRPAPVPESRGQHGCKVNLAAVS